MNLLTIERMTASRYSVVSLLAEVQYNSMGVDAEGRRWRYQGWPGVIYGRYQS